MRRMQFSSMRRVYIIAILYSIGFILDINDENKDISCFSHKPYIVYAFLSHWICPAICR